MKISSKLNELKPTDLNCNVFDVYSYDGLSMQDLLCQFFTKINECINVSNETIDLASWLVNEGLRIEVVNKLMMWLDDGTLENLINVNLFNTLNTKIDNISSQLTHKVNVTDLKYINVLDYNIKNDGITDNSKKLNDLIDSLDNAIIYFPNGTYLFNNIKLKNGISIEGQQEHNTIFKPFNAYEPMFILSNGAIQKNTYKNFSCYGEYYNIDCFKLIGTSQDMPSYHGGLWYTNFENITIGKFNGTSIHLQANYDKGDVVHQWVYFTNVKVYRGNTITSKALVLYGRCEHFSFKDCQFDGNGTNASLNEGLNILISRTMISGSPLDDKAPINILFTNTTIQKSFEGVKIDRAKNITFDNCWFEGVLKKGVTIETSSALTVVKNCYFANVGNFDSNSYVFNVGVFCNINVENNTFSYSSTFNGCIFSNLSYNHGGIFTKNNVFPTNPKSLNMIKYSSSISGGVISTGMHKTYIFAPSSSCDLVNISSDIAEGEELNLIINTGTSNTVTLKVGNFGNLTSDLTINGKKCISLVKVNDKYVNGWIIKSIY